MAAFTSSKRSRLIKDAGTFESKHAISPEQIKGIFEVELGMLALNG